jgi:uncharacterized protein (UPF0332 family)
LTPENKRQNILEELDRAGQSLRAADLLAKSGFHGDAVSRLYYFIYHSAKALLLSEGLEPKSHEGLLRLLGLHFVKTGILSTAESHTISRMMKYREEADYNPSYVFTGKDYDELRDQAMALHQNIAAYLEKGGFAPAT